LLLEINGFVLEASLSEQSYVNTHKLNTWQAISCSHNLSRC